MKPILSVVIPGIRLENWNRLFYELVGSFGGSQFEMIFVGPFIPASDMGHKGVAFRYIQDYGSPARCFQLGSTVAQGKYIAFVSDDGHLPANGFKEAVNVLDQARDIDGMTLLYSEGPGFSGTQHLTPQYFDAWHHTSLQLPLVNKEWRIAPHFMYRLDYFRELGGLDCRWEHVNMNTHDLAFRVQRCGGKMIPSPSRVLAVDWAPWPPPGQPKIPLQAAFEENDNPLFQQIYGGNLEPNIRINYDNWREAPAIWGRRFKLV
jgi:hypothetical protein